jgi:hypothetical protein
MDSLCRATAVEVLAQHRRTLSARFAGGNCDAVLVTVVARRDHGSQYADGVAVGDWITANDNHEEEAGTLLRHALHTYAVGDTVHMVLADVTVGVHDSNLLGVAPEELAELLQGERDVQQFAMYEACKAAVFGSRVQRGVYVRPPPMLFELALHADTALPTYVDTMGADYVAKHPWRVTVQIAAQVL